MAIKLAVCFHHVFFCVTFLVVCILTFWQFLLSLHILGFIEHNSFTCHKHIVHVVYFVDVAFALLHLLWVGGPKVL